MRGFDKVITRLYTDRLFNFQVLLIVCKWEHFLDAANKCLPKDKQEKLKGMVEKHGHKQTTQGSQFPMGEGGESVIWLMPQQRMHNLVHEITHAAHYLLKQRDIPLTDDTEEVYAYLVEDMFRELTKSPPPKKKGRKGDKI